MHNAEVRTDRRAHSVCTKQISGHSKKFRDKSTRANRHRDIPDDFIEIRSGMALSRRDHSAKIAMACKNYLSRLSRMLHLALRIAAIAVRMEAPFAAGALLATVQLTVYPDALAVF